jgi:hypothetical protein
MSFKIRELGTTGTSPLFLLSIPLGDAKSAFACQGRTAFLSLADFSGDS